MPWPWTFQIRKPRIFYLFYLANFQASFKCLVLSSFSLNFFFIVCQFLISQFFPLLSSLSFHSFLIFPRYPRSSVSLLFLIFRFFQTQLSTLFLVKFQGRRIHFPANKETSPRHFHTILSRQRELHFSLLPSRSTCGCLIWNVIAGKAAQGIVFKTCTLTITCTWSGTHILRMQRLSNSTVNLLSDRWRILKFKKKLYKILSIARF